MTATLLPVAVPDIGDFADVPVIEVHVKPGDAVALDDPLVTLESDKATMDVPSPAAGTVAEVSVEVGDRVSEGTTLLSLSPDGAGVAPAGAESEPEPAPGPEPALETPPAPAPALETPPAPEPAPEAPPATESPSPARGQASAGNGSGTLYASPSIRKLARELGVDLSGLTGTGRKGRITSEDVRGAAAGPARVAPPGANIATGLQLAPWPVVDFERYGPVERVALTRIQRLSGPNLARNWVMIPHVTQNDEADITELEAWRKQLNSEQAEVKYTMVSFLVAASVATLKEFPAFNASLDGEELVLKRYYNIGFAADTPGGLLVPVIKDADRKGLAAIARDLTELSGKARAGKLMPGDMAGGTFTISSLGGIGGTSFTPIINAPEVAILGATRAAMRPVWDGSGFVPRLMLPLSLSYDHRVIDGASAARFVAHLARVLGDLRRALL